MGVWSAERVTASGEICQVPVAGTVDIFTCLYRYPVASAVHHGRYYRSVLDVGFCGLGVEYDLYAGFAAHLDREELEFLRLYVGHRVVVGADAVSETCAAGLQPFDELLGDAAGPPRYPLRSIRTTLCPLRAAAMAAQKPAGPAPMTAISALT